MLPQVFRNSLSTGNRKSVGCPVKYQSLWTDQQIDLAAGDGGGSDDADDDCDDNLCWRRPNGTTF